MRRCAEGEALIDGFFDIPMAATFSRLSVGSVNAHNGWRRWPAIESAGKRRHG